MRLLTTYGHHFLFCGIQAFTLHLIHEHVLFPEFSEDLPNILILGSCDTGRYDEEH